MSKKAKSDSATPKKKKKKKGWIIALSIVLVLVVAPVVTFFALFYDSTLNKTNVDKVTDPDTKLKEMYSGALVNSLSYTTEEGNERIALSVTQDDLNQVLYTALSKVDDKIAKYVPQLDVKIKGENYDFYLNLKYSFFKTRIILKTKISSDNDAQAFIFTIKDVAICRLSGVGSLTFSMLSNFVSDEQINSMLQEYVSMTINLKARTITYPQKDLIKDIQKYSGAGTSESSKLYFSIAAGLLEKDILSFAFENKLEAKIALGQLKTNENYVDSAYNLNLTSVLNDAATSAEGLVNDGTTPAYDNSAIKANFTSYFNDHSGIGTSSDPNDIMLTHLPSFVTSETMSTAEKAAAANTFKTSANPEMTYLTESELNGYLKTTSLVGSSYIISDYQDNASTVCYITVDNFFCNFVQNTDGDFIYFSVGLNINGCQTFVIFVTKYDATASSDPDSISMKFITQAVYFGNVALYENNGGEVSALEDELISALFNMISSALADVQTMSINEADYSINVTFAFNSVVNDAITMLNSTSPTGKAVAGFNATDSLSATNGKLQIVWEND